MPSKKPKANPLGPTQGGSLAEELEKYTKDNEQIFKDVHSLIEDSQSQKSAWQQKRDLYYRMRMRMKKEKSFPFPGSSNLRLPTLEKYIRKAKAALIGLIWSAKPKAIVLPTPTGNQDAAFKLEYYLDYLIDCVLKPLKKLIILADKIQQDGFAFIETVWRMEDEKRTFEIELEQIPTEITRLIFSADKALQEGLVQSLAKIFDVDMADSVRAENEEAMNKALEALGKGEKKVRVTVADETYNNVEWNVHSAEMVHVPTDSFLDPQKARMIAVETYEPWDVVKRKAKAGIYDMEAFSMIDAMRNMDVNKLGDRGTIFRTTEETRDLKEGITRLNGSSKNVKLYRTYCWYDSDGDGIEERNVFILAPEFKVILKKFGYPYHHRKWPITRFDAEVFDDRWFSSRGYPELLEDVVKEIDTQHNQKLDQQTIRNAPMFTFRSGVVNPRLVKFIPGQGIPVPGTIPLNDAIAMMNNTNTNAEFSYRDEEMLLKSEVQELIGQVDFGLQSQINRRQPRTAQEVSGQQQAAQTVFGMDVMLFSDSMSEVLNQTIGLLQQYLPDVTYFSVVGEGQTLHLTRDEIQGGYQVRIRGNDMTVNPAQRIQQSMERTTYLTNPLYLQLGIVTPNNLFYLAKRHLQDMGEFAWQQMISPPPPPPQPGPPPAITQVKTTFDELTDAEKAQVLASGGIEPDIAGRHLAKMQEMEQGKEETSSEPASSGS